MATEVHGEVQLAGSTEWETPSPWQDEAEDGAFSPIDLSAISPAFAMIRPDGSEQQGAELTVTDAAAGEAHGEGTGDAPGVWRTRACAGGYPSAPVTWQVRGKS